MGLLVLTSKFMMGFLLVWEFVMKAFEISAFSNLEPSISYLLLSIL